MTDNAIMPANMMDMLGQIGAPAAASVSRMPLAKVSLLQSTSAIVKDPANPAKAGQLYISFDRDGITPPQLVDSLRVIVIDWFNGRVMYPFDESGKKQQGADVKPVCGSNNAINPRMGERDEYVGQTFVDYRRNKDGDYTEWTITTSCKECPLGQWMPEYEFDRKTGEVKRDADGKAIVKRGADGKVKNAMPPCAMTTTYVVYLPDFGIPARLQVKGTVAGSIKKLADFFARNPAGQRPNVVATPDGVSVKAVTLQPKLTAYRDNSDSWMLDLSWSPDYLTQEQTMRWIELAGMYQDEGIREHLTGNGYVEETNSAADEAYDEDTVVPAEAKSSTEAAREKLGHKASGKPRRMAAKDADTSNPFGDDEE